MTITRNHEEEVGLRLQFEARVNQLNTEFRELEIKHNRSLVQLQNANQHLERLTALSKDQAEQLIELRTTNTDNLSKLESLTNYKTASVQEIQKKN